MNNEIYVRFWQLIFLSISMGSLGSALFGARFVFRPPRKSDEVEVKIFNDGKYPVTCCRNPSLKESPRKFCQFLLGASTDAPKCTLFNTRLGINWEQDLIKPCDSCRRARNT